METAVISRVESTTGQARLTVSGISDQPGEATEIFRALARAEIDVDVILQGGERCTSGEVAISFTCPRRDGLRAVEVLQEISGPGSCRKISYEHRIGKVTLWGAGFRSHPVILADFSELMSIHRVRVSGMSTSEIQVSALVDGDDTERAVNALRARFAI